MKLPTSICPGLAVRPSSLVERIFISLCIPQLSYMQYNVPRFTEDVGVLSEIFDSLADADCQIARVSVCVIFSNCSLFCPSIWKDRGHSWGGLG